MASQVAFVVKKKKTQKNPCLPGQVEVRDAGSNPGLEDPLEEGLAMHSSILAWRIPWTEEPGRVTKSRT